MSTASLTPQTLPHDFKSEAGKALADPALRRTLRQAMDGLMQKRRDQFDDTDEWTGLRALGEAIRQNALTKLPSLLEELEANCRANGIQVHWAETTDEANAIALELLNRAKVKLVAKGKSMVSEEMHLNARLAEEGIQALEADLGEFIIQLANEAPSHIIMPAIHKNRRQIAHLFAENIADFAYTEDARELTEAARQELRRVFRQAGAGISGVNFAVAETGTLCLVENEGNGRMCTTVPPLHIAVMGIEKVVEKLTDLPPLLSLLTRSATGQAITTYVNMITAPRKEGELDGPEEVHLILLDNGRSRIYASEETRATLQCIRCGACMNHCPVYSRVGGHAYGGVYPGPIGKILTPQLDGLAQYPDHASASSLCNACVEVCPVKIPIAKMLVNLRNENSGHCPEPAVKDSGQGKSLAEDLAWKSWAALNTSPKSYRTLGGALSWAGGLLPPNLPLLKEWTSVRSKPRFAKQTLHQLAKREGLADE